MKLLLLVHQLSCTIAFLSPLRINGVSTATLASAPNSRNKHHTHALHAGLDSTKILSLHQKSTKELDLKILKITLPALLNFAIVPLVGAVDTYWVGRMSNALALAGQGAANQIFSSAFWIISFLPSVVTPVVAKAAGSGDSSAVQDRIGEAVFLGVIMGIIGMVALTFLPEHALSIVLPARVIEGVTVVPPARQYAAPYLAIRALTFVPALLSTVGFAAFRGTMDMQTPVKISFLSNIVNVILDPILMFKMGMGVSGAAAATCVAEALAFILYAQQLLKKKMLNASKMFRPPSLDALRPLLIGGFGVQLRAVALNIAFLAVTRTTQALDTSGTAAAAHAITIQLWQLGGIVLLALSTVASIIVPSELARAARETGTSGRREAKFAADRLLQWGAMLGVVLAGFQIGCLPLLSVFSPLPEVQQAARLPSIIGAALQVINGVVFVGEGIQQGNQAFGPLAACTAVAAAGMLLSLKTFGSTLAGVWGSFAVFNMIRLIGVLRHHFFTGPLAPANIAASEETDCAQSSLQAGERFTEATRFVEKNPRNQPHGNY